MNKLDSLFPESVRSTFYSLAERGEPKLLLQSFEKYLAGEESTIPVPVFAKLMQRVPGHGDMKELEAYLYDALYRKYHQVLGEHSTLMRVGKKAGVIRGQQKTEQAGDMLEGSISGVFLRQELAKPAVPAPADSLNLPKKHIQEAQDVLDIASELFVSARRRDITTPLNATHTKWSGNKEDRKIEEILSPQQIEHAMREAVRIRFSARREEAQGALKNGLDESYLLRLLKEQAHDNILEAVSEARVGKPELTPAEYFRPASDETLETLRQAQGLPPSRVAPKRPGILKSLSAGFSNMFGIAGSREPIMQDHTAVFVPQEKDIPPGPLKWVNKEELLKKAPKQGMLKTITHVPGQFATHTPVPDVVAWEKDGEGKSLPQLLDMALKKKLLGNGVGREQVESQPIAGFWRGVYNGLKGIKPSTAKRPKMALEDFESLKKALPLGGLIQAPDGDEVVAVEGVLMASGARRIAQMEARANRWGATDRLKNPSEGKNYHAAYPNKGFDITVGEDGNNLTIAVKGTAREVDIRMKDEDGNPEVYGPNSKRFQRGVINATAVTKPKVSENVGMKPGKEQGVVLPEDGCNDLGEAQIRVNGALGTLGEGADALRRGEVGKAVGSIVNAMTAKLGWRTRTAAAVQVASEEPRRR